MKPLHEKKISELRDDWITECHETTEDALWYEAKLKEWAIAVVKECPAYKTILTKRKVDIGYTNEEVTGRIYCKKSKIKDKCQTCLFLIDRLEIKPEELR